MGSRKWEIKSLFLVSFFLLFSFLISHFSPIHAANPKGELKKIQKRLLREKKRVEQTIEKEKSILTEMERINKLLGKKQDELKLYDDRLTRTRSKNKKLGNEIGALKDEINKRKKILKGRLVSIYKQQYGNMASILVSAKDYQELIKRSRLISYIAHHDSRLMDKFNREVMTLNDKKQHMDTLQKELQYSKKKVLNKTKEIKSERKKKNELLASVKSKRSSYEAMVKELEESSKKLRNLIKKLEEEKAASRYAGKGFGQLKGRLPWPVTGKVLVPFGRQKNPSFDIATFKKGIEIEADLGTAVLAVDGGRVVFADWFKGYGLLVIIDHGQGFHSLYANLSEIFHKSGDIIKRRQSVGKAGESGLLNVPAVYFEIRYKGKPVDPLKWLRIMKKHAWRENNV